MLDLTSLGIIIAERELMHRDGRKTFVRIGKPELYPDGPADYYCPYQISGLRSEKINYASGIDAMQALLLALKLIASSLYTSEEYKAGNLVWIDEENPDLGFPIP